MKSVSFQKSLPLWVSGKDARKNVSSEFTEKVLRVLVDKGLVKWRSIGFVREGKRKDQPTKRLFFTGDLLAYLNSRPVFIGAGEGGSDMSSKWSRRDRAGRSRIKLAKGFQIIERRRDGGYSYDFISRQKIVAKDGTTFMGRVPTVMKLIDNRQDAERKGYELMVEINKKKEITTVTDGGGCPTYSEYLPVFLAWKRADAKIRHFAVIEVNVRKLEKEKFGNLKLDKITQRTAEKYRDDQRNIVIDPTIHAKIGYLNEVLQKAKDDGYDVKKINRKGLGLAPAKVRKEFMTEEQQKVIWPLLKKYSPMDDLANMILGCTMREINMIQLRWPDILWDDEIAFVDGLIHKNHEDGEYILTDGLIKMLKKRKNENGSSNLVFVRYECGRPKPITETWIQRKWRAVKKEANEILRERGSDLRIPDRLRFYDLKATCLSRAGLDGASEFELQAIANHTDPHSLKHYVRKEAFQDKARERLKRVQREYR